MSTSQHYSAEVRQKPYGAGHDRRSVKDIETSERERSMALIETGTGLFKTEVIRQRKPWRHLDAVVFATPEWGDGFNHRRLLEPIDNMPRPRKRPSPNQWVPRRPVWF